MSLSKIGDVKRLLKKLEHHPKKALSQNFLIDEHFLSKIVKAAELEKGEVVLEIGPGLGALTKALLECSCKVIAIEKDHKLSTHLRSYFENENLTLVEQDFLKVDIDTLVDAALTGDKQAKVVANIPYNITSNVVKTLLKRPQLFSCVILMVQKELAEKMLASTSEKNYGFFSLFVQLLSKPEILFTVPAHSFYPAPKVDSAVVKLTLKSSDPLIDIEATLHLIHLAFSQRRKKLTSSLKNFFPLNNLLAAMEKVGLEEGIRPEKIALNQFIALAAALSSPPQGPKH